MNQDTNGNDDAVLRAVRRLPQEIEPRRDLWPAIEAGIEESMHPRGPGRRWIYAVAAAVGCMALGSLLTLAIVGRGPTAVAPAATAANGEASYAPLRITEASFGGYGALGPDYERARADLMINLAERLDRLPPADRAQVERNLAEIRRSLREINMALAIDPDSTLLQELLLSTYHNELAVLANVNQMAGSIPARTDS